MDYSNYHNAITREVSYSGVAWELEHLVINKKLSEWDIIQIVEIDLGSKA